MAVILMYHQVGQVPAENDPYNLALTPEQFDEQMAFLKKNDYRVISLDEAVKKGYSADKTVVITFDDGFVDLDTTIKPILDTYHFSATVFFVPGCAGQESNWEGQSGQYAAKLLTWERVKALAASGTFTFGSHTMTHPRLTQLPTEQAYQELREAKRTLEAQLGVSVDHFAYPFSDRNEAVQRIVAECGYQSASSGDRGKWDIYNMWRAQCWRTETLASFEMKVRGLYYRKVWLREESAFGPPLRKAVRSIKSGLRRR